MGVFYLKSLGRRNVFYRGAPSIVPQCLLSWRVAEHRAAMSFIVGCVAKHRPQCLLSWRVVEHQGAAICNRRRIRRRRFQTAAP
jgi:F0F1-type ATP synthase assembly protein I